MIVSCGASVMTIYLRDRLNTLPTMANHGTMHCLLLDGLLA
jgi:hypothetical protein